MHIPDDRIDPSIRRTGSLIRRVLPAFGPVTFHIAAACMNAADALRIWPGTSPRPRRVRIPRADGTALGLSVFEPLGGVADSAPAVLWIHGGGFALGAPCQDYSLIDRFVAEGCIVVSPSYRLSTRAPYPAAFDDCYAALLWMHENCRTSSGAERPLAVGGDSAGGNLAAAVCLKARDEGSVPVRFCMPLYPMLDDRMQTPSAQDNDAPVWNSLSNERAWRLYLGESFGRADVSPYAAPARAVDLAGMPPCCTYVGDIEPFHDETVAFVERLRAAGVEADFLELPGCFHGFDMVCPQSPPARKAAAFLMESFRRHLG